MEHFGHGRGPFYKSSDEGSWVVSLRNALVFEKDPETLWLLPASPRKWFGPGEVISAQGMADVLLAAWRSQYMPEFAASLPLSATDGTLRKRFRAPEMQGRLRMKTGTLDDVTALAGFVNAASCRTFVTVVVLNHPGAGQGVGESIQIALVEWVFGQ